MTLYIYIYRALWSLSLSRYIFYATKHVNLSSAGRLVALTNRGATIFPFASSLRQIYEQSTVHSLSLCMHILLLASVRICCRVRGSK